LRSGRNRGRKFHRKPDQELRDDPERRKSRFVDVKTTENISTNSLLRRFDGLLDPAYFIQLARKFALGA
jgi:hypothetical protein